MRKFMNGIAGIVYPDVYQITQMITPMLDILRHRGGSSQTVHTYHNIQIGICGESFARNEKKTIFACLDGHFTNSQELAHKLQQHGYHIRTENHAELVANAYELWGANFVDYVVGDFCIAILDQSKERLLLYRDRIGKKPLYWYQDQHHFLFASELKALLITGAVPQTAAMDSFSAYLYFGYIPQDMSPIKDVNKLLPGQYLQYDKDGSVKIVPYWSYSACFEYQSKFPQKDVDQHLNELLLKSVKSRVVPEKPVGCFISGGLGSASIAHYTSMVHPKELVKGFSVGFSGQNDEDIAAAGVVADTLHIERFSDVLTPQNFLKHFIKIMWHLDEPLADPNVTATWRIAELAKQKVTTVFSGMGSDELLAGHSRYTSSEQKGAYFQRLLHTPLSLLKLLLVPLIKSISRPYTLVKSSKTTPWQFEYLKQNALFTEYDLAIAAPQISGLFDPEVFLHKFHQIARIKSKVSFFLYFDVKTRLPDCFLQQYERLTAAQGLRWSAPYLDREIIEYLATIAEPDSLSESETASFLKMILKDVFPASVVNRPKKTRGAFLKDWVEMSELKDIFQMLSKGILVESGLISESWLREHTASPEMRAIYFRQLWGILALEVWFRLYIQKPILVSPPEVSLREFLQET